MQNLCSENAWDGSGTFQALSAANLKLKDDLLVVSEFASSQRVPTAFKLTFIYQSNHLPR